MSDTRKVTHPKVFGVSESSITLCFTVEEGEEPLDAEARVRLNGDVRATSAAPGTRLVRIEDLEPDTEYEISIESGPARAGETRYFAGRARTLPAPRANFREQVWQHELAADADLLIHDAQFTDEEYRRCPGWGHSSYRHAFEFAARVGAKEVVTFHHDPGHDDDTLDGLLDDAVRRFKPAFRVSGGREGAVYEV